MIGSWTAAIAPIVAAAILCAACGNSSSASGPGAPCTRTSDCEPGLSCGPNGFCTGGQESDAAMHDTDGGDSGSLDGRTAD